MTWFRLIQRGLTHHARAHLGVVLGLGIATAALVGALLVGDSVRASLRAVALNRLGPIAFALDAGDRFFQQDLAARLNQNSTFASVPLATALSLPGTANRPDLTARANQVRVLGVAPDAWPRFAHWVDRPDLETWKQGESLFVNDALARQLRVREGDEVLLRVRKPSLLSEDAAITPKDDLTIGFRLKVGRIISTEQLGAFDLRASRPGVMNAFLPLPILATRAGLSNSANLLVMGNAPAPAALSPGELTNALQTAFELEDAGLRLSITPSGSVQLATTRVFLQASLIESVERAWQAQERAHPGARRTRIFTYLANLLSSGTNGVPYSMVTATEPPLVPENLAPDEMIVTDWLASDLGKSAGDTIDLSYFVMESGASLVEHTNRFKIRAVTSLAGLPDGSLLMPDFPGVAKAESTRDWDTGFPLRYTIRPQDEQYWRQHRGTPKALISLSAGQTIWSNRFGSLSAFRFTPGPGVTPEAWRDNFRRELRAALDPALVGLQFQPVRAQALAAAEGSQDFGQLFIAFSFFVVLAALLLSSLLFRFNLERRAAETGTLLALGFTSRQVTRLLLVEAVLLSVLGAVLGTLLGLGYARLLLWALTTIWQDATSLSQLQFAATSASLLGGAVAGAAVGTLTAWLTLRGQSRRSARELLYEPLEPAARGQGKISRIIAGVGLAGALALGMWAVSHGPNAGPPAFFGAGALLLVGGTAATASLLTFLRAGTHHRPLTFASLSLRNGCRRPRRTLTLVALLASGSFLIIAPGVFHLDAARDAAQRDSGTGGFAWVGESALPITQDLNSAGGREFYGLTSDKLADLHLTPLRVREGDEASCLNLNRAQRPRVLGVDPDAFRGRFHFSSVAPGLDLAAGWDLLRPKPSPGKEDEVPVIGDAASIQWAMGKRVGDLLDYQAENGRKVQLRIVGAVANSMLQGNLVMDEQRFRELFPSSSGARLFFIDLASNAKSQATNAVAELARGLADTGLELYPAQRRLQEFNAVQNTYLGTFQMLGGLGFLLGSAGLGLVVLRNLEERRGELALLSAAGFSPSRLQKLVLLEHTLPFLAGLALGTASAALAVAPALFFATSPPALGYLGLILALVLANGFLCAWGAVRLALRGDLIAALKRE